MKRIAAAVAAVGIAGSAAGYAFFSGSQTFDVLSTSYWQTMLYSYTAGTVLDVDQVRFGHGQVSLLQLQYNHHYSVFMYDYHRGRFSEFFYFSNQTM